PPPLHHSFPTRRSSDLILEPLLQTVPPRLAADPLVELVDNPREVVDHALTVLVALSPEDPERLRNGRNQTPDRTQQVDRIRHERDRKNTRLNSSHAKIS